MPILVNTTNKAIFLNRKYLEVGPKGRINVTQRVLEQPETQALMTAGVLKLRGAAVVPELHAAIVEPEAESVGERPGAPIEPEFVADVAEPVAEPAADGEELRIVELESLAARRRGRPARQPD